MLLQEAEPLALGRGIVWIQHPGKGFRLESLAQRAHKVAGAEFLKIEVIRRSGGPEPQSVDRFPPIANHWTIKGYAYQAGWSVRDHVKHSVAQLERNIQLDFDLLVGPRDLPGIVVAEPVVGV